MNIEESIQQINELIEAWELNEACLNQTDIDAIKCLLKQNQELKKQLEEYKATNEVLSHELTKDKILQQDCLTTCCGIPIGDIPKLITQQKEFIKYLKDMLDNENDIFSVVRVKDVLNKYKETIGVKDE